MPATNSSATVKGGFFETNQVATLTGIRGKASMRRAISILLGKKSMLMIRRKIDSILVNGVGGTVSLTLARIQASSELGGLRTIESETLSSGVSDGPDRSEIRTDFLGQTSNTTFGSSPPANLDRNPLGTR